MAVVLGAVLLIVGVLVVADVFLRIVGWWPTRSDRPTGEDRCA